VIFENAHVIQLRISRLIMYMVIILQGS